MAVVVVFNFFNCYYCSLMMTNPYTAWDYHTRSWHTSQSVPSISYSTSS